MRFRLCTEKGALADAQGVCSVHHTPECVADFHQEPPPESRIQAENRVLRGLIQTNPEWRCPFGVNPKPTMEHCPLGFPGCACADDRLSVLIEDSERVLEAIKTQRDELLVKSTRFAMTIAIINRQLTVADMPSWVREALEPTLKTCKCDTCRAVKHAAAESTRALVIDLGTIEAATLKAVRRVVEGKPETE